MANITSIVASLVCYYGTDAAKIAEGIALAETKIPALIDAADQDRVIYTSIEGNQFRWSEEGLSNGDRLAIWTRLKKDLEGLSAGNAPSACVFTPSFKRIEI